MTEKIARRPLDIGAYHLEPGEVLTDTVERILPPGRMKVLVDHGWIAERPAAADPRIAELEARIEALEERMANHKHVGRPPREG